MSGFSDLAELICEDTPDEVPVFLKGPPGIGKCLGEGTPVLLADGRILPVERIVQGDRLMGPDGKARTVLSTTVGRGPLYRIDPVKGEPWVCNDVHVLTLVNTDTGDLVDIGVDKWLEASANFRDSHELVRIDPHAPDEHMEQLSFTADPIGEGDYYGFMVDGDGRFLLGDFTVTHNSALCQAVSASFAKRAESLARSFAFDRWELTVHQPEDLSGIPFAHNGWMRFCPPERLAPFCVGAGVDGTDPIGCLIFEDVTHASQAVKNGMLQLVQERTLGALVLSPDVRILMTGNRTSDKAGARDLLSALKNRILVLELQPNLEEWMLWAGARGIPSVIGGFLSWKPGSFSTLPSSECKENGQYATPRSWANVGYCINRVFRNGSTSAAYDKLLTQAKGLVGHGHAHEFVAFARIKEEYPDPKKILEDPENALPDPPTKADRVIALVTALGDYTAHHQDEDKAIYLKLLLALSWISGKNREGCAAGVSVFQACGGDVAQLVNAADMNKKDGRVLAVLKFFAEATK